MGILAPLGHADHDRVNSYEQLILLVRRMHLGQGAETEVFRRAVFDPLGRNQDDHTRNVGFLMDRLGTWRLAPAFDLTYALDPAPRNGTGTRHQERSEMRLLRGSLARRTTK